MARPSFFVGASAEGLDIARKVRAQLKHDAEVTLWTEGVFQLNESVLGSLLYQLELTDFAAIVLTPDDLTVSRGHSVESPRDNTLLELGLFLGHLGRRRTFAIYDSTRALKLPSDLLGITHATYDGNRRDGNLMAAVGEACDAIREALIREGPRVRSAPVAPVTLAARRRSASGVLWVFGSYGSLSDTQRKLTQRLLVPLAAGLIGCGFRVVMGDSDMLRDLAMACRDASLASGPADRVATMLFGSLRQPNIRDYFRRAVGAEPVVALLLGGNKDRGRTRGEYDIAVANRVPVLAVPATGGVAAEAQSSVELSDAEQRVLGESLDIGDLSRMVVTVLARYSKVTRNRGLGS
jgi:hypothetical protein